MAAITYTESQLNAWRARHASGYTVPYDTYGHSTGSYAEMVQRASDLYNGIVDDRRTTNLDVSPGADNNGQHVGALAFMYLISQNASYGNFAKNYLLAEIRKTLADWAQYNPATSPRAANVNIPFSSVWWIRLFHVFEWTRELYTASEILEIEAWFDDWAQFYADILHDYLAPYFPNRLNRVYTPPPSETYNTPPYYTHQEPLGTNKNKIAVVHQYYSNSHQMTNLAVGLWALYANDSDLMLKAKIWFEEALKFATYPDGTDAEYRRNGNYGNQAQGANFYGIAGLEHMIYLAHVYWINGDSFFYNYSTTDGLYGTEIGGINGNGKGSKSIRNRIEAVIENYTQEVVRHSTVAGSDGETRLLNKYRDDNFNLPEVFLSYANLRFNEDRLQNSYLNNIAGTNKYTQNASFPVGSAGFSFGGTFGILPCVPFMAYQMEGVMSPTANAGADKSITLPISSVSLDGSASSDPDDTIVSYAWIQLSGPNTANIVSQSSAQTVVNGLVQGAYIFRLTVTDNYGNTSTDTVQVTVNAAPSQTGKNYIGYERRSAHLI